MGEDTGEKTDIVGQVLERQTQNVSRPAERGKDTLLYQKLSKLAIIFDPDDPTSITFDKYAKEHLGKPSDIAEMANLFLSTTGEIQGKIDIENTKGEENAVDFYKMLANPSKSQFFHNASMLVDRIGAMYYAIEGAGTGKGWISKNFEQYAIEYRALKAIREEGVRTLCHVFEQNNRYHRSSPINYLSALQLAVAPQGKKGKTTTSFENMLQSLGKFDEQTVRAAPLQRIQPRSSTK